MAETEVPKKAEETEVAPPTRDELVAKLEQISDRAREAGLSPLRLLAQSYAARGMKALDGILSAMEDAPKKPPAEEKKA